ncbi:hypothetical protein P152DRAFT_405752 [Eremomyces bilateralis CBS 781.70]|uniref:Uncharacterized protein n=1 Tax=Eremomyces bilateralis CBS 781.70 TaxID=1392243 RepID=A0A6G1FR92_9PEZI|nr:uncharacterized protein P152DRAFT_405752 [Eremomyces bilateralis CBS 781.70]KAF1808297.1 hypothetical protein P152DRAFT_405752 [Eremomyces bilateralis CBS 781.70]
MPVSASSHYPISKEQLDEIRLGWTTWTATEPRPTRDASGTLHFASHPDFQPNKSPSEILREGSFGGTYFRPLYSKALGTTISDDWRELPSSWVKGLNISKFLTSSEYDPTINKFGVACGQSIEEWEAAGWIHHQYDVRGWLQWYCRFFMGRRCDDDEWQIGRWMRCAGDTGRWKRALLKNYVAMGVRNVADEGLDEAESVSPVIHQTCHHWAFEAKQPILDEFWETQ